MPNILTESLRLKNLNNLVNTLNTQSVYFSFSGPVTVTNPTQPQDSYGINADVFSDALYLKKITSTNFVNVIPNYGWISGARYQQFDSTVDISTLTTVQSFIPATATATVSGGSLIITVTNPGSGYTSVPSVTFSFGTAVATATISAGSVTAIVITSGNSGYSTAPTISISAPSIIQSTAFDMQPFYVITPQYRVYKCLNNNSGAISTVLPTSISTSASTPAALADGYVWKYMYTLSTIDQEFFYTTNWIPVRYITVNDGSDQWTIQQNAIAGSSPYHGANAVTELGGTNLMVKVRVNGSEGGQIVDTSQYSQIGLVSNPIQTGSYWTSSGGATGPNTLQLAAGHAAAIGATSPQTSYIGYPTVGKNMVILGGRGAGQVNTIAGVTTISGATGAVWFTNNWTITPDNTSVYGVIPNATVLNQTTVLSLATTGTFTVGSNVTGSSSGTTATVVKYDSTNKLLYVTLLSGTGFTVADSVNSVSIIGITQPALTANLGDILYLENRKSIQRYPDQNEDVKVVIEF